MNKSAFTKGARVKYESGFLREAERQKTLLYYRTEKNYNRKMFIAVGVDKRIKRKAIECQIFKTSPPKK